MFKNISSGLKNLFGTKYDRDVATYQPVVEEINAIYPGLAALTNDELRNKTLQFRARIAEYLEEIDVEIEQLKKQAGESSDIGEKEQLFADVDKLVKQRDEELEIVLKEILQKPSP